MRYNNLEVKTYDKIEIDRNLIPPWGGKQRRPATKLIPSTAEWWWRGCNIIIKLIPPLRTILVGDGALDVPPY